MVALGVLAGAGRTTVPFRRRPFLAIATVLVALFALASFASPRAAESSVRESTRALDDRDFDAARDSADRARLLNPLSVEPIWALARVDERQGRYSDAEERYVQAVELQPENPETWYALGLYEFQVRGNMCAAYEFLNNAYTLDPAGSQWVEGGELDIARDAVNKGACEPGYVAGRRSASRRRLARVAQHGVEGSGRRELRGQVVPREPPDLADLGRVGSPAVPVGPGEVVADVDHVGRLVLRIVRITSTQTPR